jgi:septum site-determining protein MinD
MSVITVLGRKGGVGKSTVVANCGIAASTILGEKGRVLVIDADPGIRSLAKLLVGEKVIDPDTGTSVEPNTLHDVIWKKITWEDAIYVCNLEDPETRVRLYPNFHIMPAGRRFLSDVSLEKLSTTARFLQDMLLELRKIYSLILVDSPAGMSREHIATICAADFPIMIVTPDDHSLDATMREYLCMKEVTKTISPAGVVINRVPGEDISKWVKWAEQIAPVVARIPDDPLNEVAYRENFPVISRYPDAQSSKAYVELAKWMLNLETGKRVGFAERLMRIVKRFTRNGGVGP